MKCYIVTFETNSDDSRKAVEEQLGTYKSRCPIHASCWAILTDKSAVSIRDALRDITESQDRVFVVRSGVESAWSNSYGKEYNTWLKDNL